MALLLAETMRSGVFTESKLKESVKIEAMDGGGGFQVVAAEGGSAVQRERPPACEIQ